LDEILFKSILLQLATVLLLSRSRQIYKMAFPVEPTVVEPLVCEPELLRSKGATSTQVEFKLESAASIPDSAALANKIAASTQESEYYRKFQPDYKVQQVLFGEPCTT
jgi:hypothetical protein